MDSMNLSLQIQLMVYKLKTKSSFRQILGQCPPLIVSTLTSHNFNTSRSCSARQTLIIRPLQPGETEDQSPLVSKHIFLQKPKRLEKKHSRIASLQNSVLKRISPEEIPILKRQKKKALNDKTALKEKSRNVEGEKETKSFAQSGVQVQLIERRGQKSKVRLNFKSSVDTQTQFEDKTIEQLDKRNQQFTKLNSAFTIFKEKYKQLAKAFDVNDDQCISLRRKTKTLTRVIEMSSETRGSPVRGKEIELNLAQERIEQLQTQKARLSKQVESGKQKLLESEQRIKASSILLKEISKQISKLSQRQDHFGSSGQTVFILQKRSKRLLDLQKKLTQDIDQLFSNLNSNFDLLTKEEIRLLSKEKFKYVDYLHRQRFMELNAFTSELRVNAVQLAQDRKLLQDLFRENHSMQQASLKIIQEFQQHYKQLSKFKGRLLKKIQHFGRDCQLCLDSGRKLPRVVEGLGSCLQRLKEKGESLHS